MTSTMVRPCKAVAEWLQVFHAQGTESYTSSVSFVKRLTIIALSYITYLKNWFPENCYTSETFAGMRLKILKSKCKDKRAQYLSTAITKAFDVLDKKYLHQLAVLVYEGERKQENLRECCLFQYEYSSEGVAMTIHNKNSKNKKQSQKFTFDNVQHQTKILIRACIVMMQSCSQSLPESAEICVYLYLNNDMPVGYVIPGYDTASGEDDLEPTLSEAVHLGCVETPYHKTIVKTYMRNIEDYLAANASPKPPVMPNPDSDDFSLHRTR